MGAIAIPRSKRGTKPISGRRQRKQKNWLKRNRAALRAYNEHVEKHGVFSEGLRSF